MDLKRFMCDESLVLHVCRQTYTHIYMHASPHACIDYIQTAHTCIHICTVRLECCQDCSIIMHT